MGKPFEKELEKLPDTYSWALAQNVESLRSVIINTPTIPTYIVGSGGSLSVCYYVVSLLQQYGIVAKAVTPLELIYAYKTLRKSRVIFISASGRNTDILNSYEIALKNEAYHIYVICMRKDSKLAKRAISEITTVFEFDLPTGKDGFLATNSLLAFFSIFYKAFELDKNIRLNLDIQKSSNIELLNFISSISTDFTFTILYGGISQCVAIDLESKLAEAALGNILLSDYRNFGHGRHHWFAKRSGNSAIIALITPDNKKLAQKTLSLLPKKIPMLIIESEDRTFYSCISMLTHAFAFVNLLGKIQDVDPGRPGVPDFGSKLYHLNYASFYKPHKSELQLLKETSILRKTQLSSYDQLSISEQSFWSKAYEDFVTKIQDIKYGSIVFDYDGTLCSNSNRYSGIDKSIVPYITKLISNGITVGIATGRGKSVREDLQKCIPKKWWSSIVVGYYNSSDIGLLSDNSLPNKTKTGSINIRNVYEKLMNQKFFVKVNPELKPYQITVEISDKGDWLKVRSSILQFIMEINQTNIQVLESTHSMDIVDIFYCNKLNILSRCRDISLSNKLPTNILCIGDKGKWPGNDYQLLSTEYSLSVEEVSPLPHSCWNLAPSGIRNINATIYYLSKMNITKKGINVTLT